MFVLTNKYDTINEEWLSLYLNVKKKKRTLNRTHFFLAFLYTLYSANKTWVQNIQFFTFCDKRKGSSS